MQSSSTHSSAPPSSAEADKQKSAQLKFIQGTVDALAPNFQGLADELATLTVSASATQTVLDRIETSLDRVEPRLGALEARLAALATIEARVTALERIGGAAPVPPRPARAPRAEKRVADSAAGSAEPPAKDPKEPKDPWDSVKNGQQYCRRKFLEPEFRQKWATPEIQQKLDEDAQCIKKPKGSEEYHLRCGFVLWKLLSPGQQDEVRAEFQTWLASRSFNNRPLPLETEPEDDPPPSSVLADDAATGAA
jgi:hypothetical protein